MMLKLTVFGLGTFIYCAGYFASWENKRQGIMVSLWGVFLIALTLSMTGCALGGIRAPDGWDPPPIKECYKTVNKVCYTRQEWEDFVRKTFGREYL